MLNSKYIPEKDKEEISEITQMLKNVSPQTRGTVKGFLLGAECVEQALKANKETDGGERKSA